MYPKMGKKVNVYIFTARNRIALDRGRMGGAETKMPNRKNRPSNRVMTTRRSLGDDTVLTCLLTRGTGDVLSFGAHTFHLSKAIHSALIALSCKPDQQKVNVALYRKAYQQPAYTTALQIQHPV